jgi:hypothetical protein
MIVESKPVFIVDFTNGTDFCGIVDAFKKSINLDLNPWLQYLKIDNESEREKLKKFALELFDSSAKFNFNDEIITANKDNPNLLDFDVHIIGNIRDITSEFFQTFDELRKLSFCRTPNILYYFHLWIPESLDISGRMTDKDNEFLVVLHNLQSVAQEPMFNGGVYVYSSDNNEDFIKDSYHRMFLATSTLSFGSPMNEFERSNLPEPNTIFQANAQGIFHEKETYIEQQAYILGDLLLKAFKDSKNKPFFNTEGLKRSLELINIESLLKANEINFSLASKNRIDIDLNRINELLFNKSISSNQIGSPSVLLNQFYLGFLYQIKKNLINEVQKEIQFKWEDYKIKIDEQVQTTVYNIQQKLSQGIFEIFNHENPSQQCTLQQALALTERLEDKSNGLFQDFEKEKVLFNFEEMPLEKDKRIIFSFVPKVASVKDEKGEEINGLHAALITANLTYQGLSNKDKQNEIVGHIETIVKNYPIVWWAQFTRVALSVFCLILITGPIIGLFNGAAQNSFTNYKFMGVGAVLSFLPLIIFWWQNRQRKQTLVSMVNQYIAVALEELNEKALNYNRNKVSECMQMVCTYLTWVKTDKIQKRLIGGLQLQKPKDFSFTPSKSFQPLFTIPVSVEDLTDDSTKKKNVSTQIISAAFGTNEEPVFDDLSKVTTKVKCPSGQITLIDLVNNDEKKVELLQKLMEQKVKVNKLYSDATIKQDSALKSLLLLDVSGSMRGENFDKLKQVVSNLKDTHKENLKWIAFSNEAKTDEECSNEIPRLFGYTNLKSAFDKVAQYNASGFDKVILVSDGLPTTKNGQFLNDAERQELCHDAFSINKPLDVIYIGNDDAGIAFMKVLAETTGGKSYEQSIHSLDERLRQNVSIKYDIKDTDKTKRFDELLKEGNTEACLMGIQQFCIEKINDVSSNIEQYLMEFSSSSGVEKFIESTAKFEDVKSPLGNPVQLIYKYHNEQPNFKGWLDSIYKNCQVVSRNDQTFQYKNSKQILNTIIALRQIKDLGSLKIDKKYMNITEYNFNEKILEGVVEPKNLNGLNITFTNNLK